MNKNESKNIRFQTSEHTDFACNDELELGEICLKNYNKHVSSLFLNYINAADSNILDFGAGIGTLAKIIGEEFGVNPDCLEIDASFKDRLVKSGFFCISQISDITKKYDLIYSSNVFEHILDDVSVMSEVANKLAPGGVIAIYVPAFMFLYSDFDVHAGHYRRYTAAELSDKLGGLGLDVVETRYVDSIGGIFWALLKFKNKIFPAENKLASKSSLMTFDKFILPFSVLFDFLGMRKVFGKNVLVVAKRKA